MKEVYILLVQGWGDREDEYVNVGVYSSLVNAETAQRNAIAEWDEDTGGQLVTDIQVFAVDA